MSRKEILIIIAVYGLGYLLTALSCVRSWQVGIVVALSVSIIYIVTIFNKTRELTVEKILIGCMLPLNCALLFIAGKYGSNCTDLFSDVSVWVFKTIESIIDAIGHFVTMTSD